jgi:hypothetical protein
LIPNSEKACLPVWYAQRVHLIDQPPERIRHVDDRSGDAVECKVHVVDQRARVVDRQRSISQLDDKIRRRSSSAHASPYSVDLIPIDGRQKRQVNVSERCFARNRPDECINSRGICDGRRRWRNRNAERSLKRWQLTTEAIHSSSPPSSQS